MTSFWEILKASKGLSHEPFACLAAQSMAGGKVAELSGIPPLSFLSNGKPLVEYQIDGKTVQNGIPTPESPIEVKGVGDLVESGEHAGQYAVPISSNGTTAATIYLDSPLCGTGDVLDEYDSTGKIVRKWRKLELTGTELGITKRSSPENSWSIAVNVNGWPVPTLGNGISSHFIRSDTISRLVDGKFYVGTTAISVHIDECTDVAAFKAYLAAQYAAGTPVTVVYQLATPTEESISAPQINTVKGTNVLTVDTTVQPSNVNIKYKV